MVLKRATRFGVSVTAKEGVSPVPDNDPSHPTNTQPLAALSVTGRLLPCAYQPEGSLGNDIVAAQLGITCLNAWYSLVKLAVTTLIGWPAGGFVTLIVGDASPSQSR